MSNLKTILSLLEGAELKNCPSPESIEIEKVLPLTGKNAKFISFVSSKAFVNDAKASEAAAILVTPEIAELIADKTLIVVPQVELALSTVLLHFSPLKKPDGKIASNAVIHPTAKIGENTSIGNFVTVGEGSVIGKNCLISDGVKIDNDVVIGDESRIGMNCAFYHGTRIGNRFTVFANSTFGGDGFGFVFANGKHNKLPQVGRVIIGDDVEVGANCTVDRGAITDTTIGNGCKFDNMVHIAHNCKVGNHVVIAGQSGLAGSVTLGDYVIIGGACAISDHLTLVEGTIIAGGTSLRTSPKAKDVYIGWDLGLNFPDFQKYRVNIKNIVVLNKWIKRIKDVEKKLGIDLPDPS